MYNESLAAMKKILERTSYGRVGPPVTSMWFRGGGGRDQATPRHLSLDVSAEALDTVLMKECEYMR